MNPTLDDFEAAFDGAAPPLDSDRAWERIERSVRRRLRGPTWDLVGGLLVFLLFIAAGLQGIENGWLLAGFFLLVVLPGRWKARKKWLADIASVESADDVRKLCAKQARSRMARVVGSSFLLTLLGVLYLATALVAHFLGRTPLPGTVAALVVFAWVAFKLLVRLPLASREWVILDAGE